VIDCSQCGHFTKPDLANPYGGCCGGGNENTVSFYSFTEKGVDRCLLGLNMLGVHVLPIQPLTPAEQRVIEAIRAIRYGSVTVEVANGVLTLLRKGETEKL
jgi:hypothetical protein